MKRTWLIAVCLALCAVFASPASAQDQHDTQPTLDQSDLTDNDAKTAEMAVQIKPVVVKAKRVKRASKAIRSSEVLPLYRSEAPIDQVRVHRIILWDTDVAGQYLDKARLTTKCRHTGHASIDSKDMLDFSRSYNTDGGEDVCGTLAAPPNVG